MIDELRQGRLPISAIGDGSDIGTAEVASLTQRLIPDGWYLQNQLTLNRLYQECCLPLVDAEKHRVNVRQTEDADDVPELKKRGLWHRLEFPDDAATWLHSTRDRGRRDPIRIHGPTHADYHQPKEQAEYDPNP